MKVIVYEACELRNAGRYSIITDIFTDVMTVSVVYKRPIWKFARWKFFVGESPDHDTGKCHMT